MASENFAPHAHARMIERGLEQQPTTNRFGTLWIPPYRGVAISDCRHPRTTSSDGWIRPHGRTIPRDLGEGPRPTAAQSFSSRGMCATGGVIHLPTRSRLGEIGYARGHARGRSRKATSIGNAPGRGGRESCALRHGDRAWFGPRRTPRLHPGRHVLLLVRRATPRARRHLDFRWGGAHHWLSSDACLRPGRGLLDRVTRRGGIRHALCGLHSHVGSEPRHRGGADGA